MTPAAPPTAAALPARAASWALAAAALALVLVAGPRLVATWLEREHGLAVVAPLAGLAAWWARSRAAGPDRPWLRGTAWWVAGVALVALGARSGGWRAAWVGLVPALWGAAALARGDGLLRRGWPAAGLLLLAVPHPNAPTYALIGAGKGLVGAGAAWVLSLLGTPARLDGWVIALPGATELRLVDACSGARNQAGLLLVVALLLALRPASPAVRATLVLATAPAALVASTLRVVAVGLVLARPDASPDLRTWVHDVSGLLVIVPGVVLVVAAAGLVGLLERERAAARALAAPPALPDSPRPVAPLDVGPPEAPPGAVAASPSRRAALAALGLLGAAVAAWPAAPCRGEPPALPASARAEGPATLDLEGLARGLGPGAVSSRVYGAGHAASAAVLLHAHGHAAPHDLFEHAPETCLAVGGWTPVRSEVLLLPLGPVRRLELVRGDRRQLLHYAYRTGDGAWHASPVRAWLTTLMLGLRGRSTAGELLLVSTADLPAVTDLARHREAARVDALQRALGAPGP